MPRHFETPRLRARPVTLDDLPLFDALHRDARVMEMLGGVLSTHRTRERLVALVEHWARHDYGVWLLDDAAGSIGYAGFVAADIGEMELICALSPTRWNSGYATEVGRAFTRIGIHDLGFESILIRYFAEHLATARVTQRLGYRYVGYHPPRLQFRYRPAPLLLEGAQPDRVLREACRADAAALHALSRSGAAAPDLDDVDAAYHDRGGRFDVVQRGQRLVASIGLWPLENDECAVRRLYVGPEERALVPALVAHAVRMAREVGFLRLVLDARALPHDLRAACEQHGFAPAASSLPDATHVLSVSPSPT